MARAKERQPPAPRPTAVKVRIHRASKSQREALVRGFYRSVPAEMWERILGSKPAAAPAGKLLALLHDKAFSRYSIEKLCAEAGLEFRDLVELVSEHSLGSAIIESTRHIPIVVEGIAEDAKNTYVVCDLCLGYRDPEAAPDSPTTIEVQHPRDPAAKLTIECPKCGGKSRTKHSGDARARETFLKLHGGLTEEKGPAVQINQQFNSGFQHSRSVQRGQELLEEGRRARGTGAETGAGTAGSVQAVEAVEAVEAEVIP